MIRLVNRFETLLDGDILAADTSIAVVSASALPDISSEEDYTILTIIGVSRETIRVNSVSGNTLTVVRGQDGTVARDFTSGTRVGCLVTVETVTSIRTDTGAIKTLIAGEDLATHRMVTLDASGDAIYADSATVAHAGHVLGITLQTVSSGSAVEIRSAGYVLDSTWLWDITKNIVLSTNGQLTQTIPASGFSQIIGLPMSETELVLQFHPPIIR